MLKRANLCQAKNIYRKYLRYDFLPEERMPYKKFKRLIKNNTIVAYAFYQENDFLGYCIAGVENNALFIYYLAIAQKYRDLGYGSKLLKELINQIKNKDYIALEADATSMAKNEIELEIINKRRNFYFKNGFKELENIDYNIYGVDYNLFVYQLNNNIKDEEIIETVRKIYQKIKLDMRFFNVQMFKKEKIDECNLQKNSR